MIGSTQRRSSLNALEETSSSMVGVCSQHYEVAVNSQELVVAEQRDCMMKGKIALLHYGSSTSLSVTCSSQSEAG